jgi:3-methyladenine DNA glycosylase/8-oxoguanine DNA glycosylase
MQRIIHQVNTVDINLSETLRWQRLGPSDLSTVREEGLFAKAFRTQKHRAQIEVRRPSLEDPCVEVTLVCEEEDAARLSAMVPGVLGLEDTTHASFEPEPRVLRDIRAQGRRVRLVHVPWLYELLVGIVLQQRVAYVDAARSHHWLVREFGEPFGDAHDALRLFPSPTTLMRLAPEAFREAGVDRERADRLRNVGRTAHHLHKLHGMSFAEARTLLGKIRGLGPWTIENLMGAGLGDPDALPLGDYWLPHTVAYALAGEPRADDNRMVALLEPLRPHRYRALQWLMLAGAKPVRFGPRMPPAGPR